MGGGSGAPSSGQGCYTHDLTAELATSTTLDPAMFYRAWGGSYGSSFEELRAVSGYWGEWDVLSLSGAGTEHPPPMFI